MQTPTEAVLSDPPMNGRTEGQFMTQLVAIMREIYHEARSNLHRSAAQNESRYNKLKNPVKFDIGQRVLIFSPRVKKGCTPKWTRFWGHEAVVMKKLNDKIYLVRYENTINKTQLVHVDKLRALPES